MADLRPVLGSVEELLAGADRREPMLSAGKSGARLERVRIDGETYVVKYLDIEADWTMRAAGVPDGAVVELWRRGLLDRLPDCFVQPIVAELGGSHGVEWCHCFNARGGTTRR